jgi:tetratricopeptide (TPR) repeat protein
MDKVLLDKKNTALEHRKNGEFSIAMPLYKDLWLNHRSACNEWDGWGYAKCLKELGDIKGALDICRQYYSQNKDFIQGNNLYAWCIYETTIKIEYDEIKKDEYSFYKGANAILDLVDQENTTPYSKTILKICDYLSKTNNLFPSEAILSWIDKLNPEKLSTKDFSFVGSDEKVHEIASEREKFYAFKSKALEKLNRYQECADICKEALEGIEKFHYSNDIWFKRRLAISLSMTGDEHKALEILHSILNLKREWFLYYDISKVLYSMKDYARSLKYAVKGAMLGGKSEYKWELFFLMAKLYKETNEVILAKRHSEFAYYLRKENDWGIPDDLEQFIESVNGEPDITKNTKTIYKDLYVEWNNFLLNLGECLAGTIKAILPNGYAGFITDDEKNIDYYFIFRDCKMNKETVKPGLKVSFSVTDSFDKKKQKESKVAIDIRKIDK